MVLCASPLSTVWAAKSLPSIATIDSVLTDSTVLAGQVVYVDFWASWCVPCRKSFPWMEDEHKKYASQGFEVVTIDLDKSKAASTDFRDKMNVSLPVVYDSVGTLAKRFGVDVMPSSFIYARDGKVREQHRGYKPEDAPALDSLIRTLLEEKTKP
jgi:thiol-disulfide isomerase/thioredoxin